MSDAFAPDLVAAAEEQIRWACSDLTKLPAFPSEHRLPADMMRAAYCWASFMVCYHGAALAPYHAHRQMMLALDEADLTKQTGWAAIIQAMTDLARVAGPDDMVH
jgi:hypothetical protein